MRFIFLFFFILILNISLVYSLSISPAELEFNMNLGDKVCREIVLTNSNPVNVIGSDRWTIDTDSKGKLNEYLNPAEDFKINIEYDKEIEKLSDKTVEVCITAREKGRYYGALMYHVNKGGGASAGVGTWIWMNVGNVSKDYTTGFENKLIRKDGEKSVSIISEKESESGDSLSGITADVVAVKPIIGGLKSWIIVILLVIIGLMAYFIIKNRRSYY